mgnify:FL=1
MEAFGTVLEQELPDCQVNTGNWILPLLLLSIGVYFVYIIRVWGFPIVAVAIFVAGYTVVTSAAWYLEECLPSSQYWDVLPDDLSEANAPARIIRFLDSITGEE